MKCGWCGHVQDVRTWDAECRACGECEFVELEINYSALSAESKTTMNIINLTPHTINIQTMTDEQNEAIENGDVMSVANPDMPKWINVPPSGQLARVEQKREVMASVDGIPVTRSTFGEIEGLPDPQPNTIYIVSGLVLSRTNRQDVFAPGDGVRNEAGQIIGCKGLSAAPLT